MKVLYHAYLERVGKMIERSKRGRTWRQERDFALRTIGLAKWLYPEGPHISDDWLLVDLATHGHQVERAREIVNEVREGKKHRPISPKVRRDSIRAYDLHLHKNSAQIAQALYERRDRNCVEMVRQRVREVERLLKSLHLSVPSTR